MPDLSTQLREYFDATTSPVEVEEVVSDDLWVPSRRKTQSSRSISPGWAYGIAATFVVLALIVGLAPRMPGGNENEGADSTPSRGPESSFLGTWATTDNDGSAATTTFEVTSDGVVEMVGYDDYTSVCSGASSTMTGTGRLESDIVVVIPTPLFTCDDGTEPQALSGPPLEQQLQNLTFTYDPETETLTDNLGMVWSREGSERPSPDPTATGWWPQSNREEVAEAQERADAGDPAYTWQLDADLAAEEPGGSGGSEIYARFIEQQLGWEQYITGASFMGVSNVFIRCEPGGTNPLNDLYAEAPPGIRRCAPTIDDFTYETVSIHLRQPGLVGPSGIWVVDSWEMLPSESAPGSLWGLLYPDFPAWQLEQVVPPSEAEVTALLEAFLRARVDGEGAEQYLLREPDESPFEDVSVPLLYATTHEALYERFETEKVQGPVWPNGWFEYKVRLFAGGDTVVEQRFHVVRRDGQLGLVYGYGYDDLPTTENGQSVPVPYSVLDDEVTFAVAPPWGHWSEGPTSMTFSGGRDEWFVIAADPPSVGKDCANGSAPADAEALARSIMADTDLETTEPVPVRIAGIDGVQMDVVVAADGYLCYWDQWALEMMGTGDAGWRMRLYLIDYPGSSAQVLAIAAIARSAGLEQVIEETKPIIESIELHSD